MTIDIVRVKPNKREGAQGEIRLLLAGEGVSQNRLMSGAVLMVKAGNDWHSVAMVPTLSQLNHIRKELENLRRQIIQVTDADGDGYGNFEYAVPSGYYSLNTKNLAEFG